MELCIFSVWLIPNIGSDNMKRLICLILSVAIILCSFESLSFSSFGITDDTITADKFASSISSMIRRYSSPLSTQSYSQQEDTKYISKRLIVKSKENINTLDAVSVISGYRDLWILQFSSAKDAEEAYNYYEDLSCVEYVEPDGIVELTEISESDTHDIKSEYLSWGPEHIGFDTLNEFIVQNEIIFSRVSVAVIDSGVDHTHEFLEQRVKPTGFNASDSGIENSSMDDYGHGTLVAGVIADCTPSNVVIYPYKVMNQEGKCYDSALLSAIYKAVEDGIDVINLSLGKNSFSTAMLEALKTADKNKIVIVAAAGNNGTNTVKAYPAAYDFVVAVSSIGQDNNLSDFSNYGTYINLTAPGDKINSTYLNNSYKISSGTSLSAPFVSAAAAMVKAVYGKINASKVRTILYSSATDLPNENYLNEFFGNGLVNAENIANEDNIHDIEYTIIKTDDKGYISSCISNETNVVIPETIDGVTIKGVGKYAFSKSNCLNVVFPATVTVIDDYAFYLCKDLISVTANSVTSIGKNAFKGCTALTCVSIDSMKNINDYTFYELAALSTVSLKSAESIGNHAFSGCTALTSVTIDSLKSIGDYTFRWCKALSSISLESVESIGDYAFNSAGNGLNAALPELTQLGYCAFYKSGITTVDLPKLTSLSEHAFRESTLTSISCNSLKIVPDYAFYGCDKLVNADLPEVNEIGNYAFYGCKSFKTLQNNSDITFSNCEKLGVCAFENCSAIESVYFPVLESMYTGSFAYCNQLERAVFPELKKIYLSDDCNGTMPETTYFVAPKSENSPSDFYIDSDGEDTLSPDISELGNIDSCASSEHITLDTATNKTADSIEHIDTTIIDFLLTVFDFIFRILNTVISLRLL